MQKIELTFDDIWHTGERSWKQIVTEYPTILFGLGIANEGEANFYSYLVCTASQDKAVKAATHQAPTMKP